MSSERDIPPGVLGRAEIHEVSHEVILYPLQSIFTVIKVAFCAEGVPLV